MLLRSGQQRASVRSSVLPVLLKVPGSAPSMQGRMAALAPLSGLSVDGRVRGA
jgi:hypothetical protein